MSANREEWRRERDKKNYERMLQNSEIIKSKIEAQPTRGHKFRRAPSNTRIKYDLVGLVVLVVAIILFVIFVG